MKVTTLAKQKRLKELGWSPPVPHQENIVSAAPQDRGTAKEQQKIRLPQMFVLMETHPTTLPRDHQNHTDTL